MIGQGRATKLTTRWRSELHGINLTEKIESTISKEYLSIGIVLLHIANLTMRIPSQTHPKLIISEKATRDLILKNATCNKNRKPQLKFTLNFYTSLSSITLPSQKKTVEAKRISSSWAVNSILQTPLNPSLLKQFPTFGKMRRATKNSSPTLNMRWKWVRATLSTFLSIRILTKTTRFAVRSFYRRCFCLAWLLKYSISKGPWPIKLKPCCTSSRYPHFLSYA